MAMSGLLSVPGGVALAISHFMIEGLSMMCHEIDDTELTQPQTELADWHMHVRYIHVCRNVTEIRNV